MPLNSTPCTVNVRRSMRKRAALEQSSVTDFGLWGGLVPGNVQELPGLAERGAVGFKAFLCDSGLPEFPLVDEDHALRRHARRGGAGLASSSARGESGGCGDRREVVAVRDYLASRP